MEMLKLLFHEIKVSMVSTAVRSVELEKVKWAFYYIPSQCL
jgi:hypothetical protein